MRIKNKKYYFIIIVLTVVALLFKINYAKNKPTSFFSNQNKIEKIFLEFTSRDDTKYSSEISSTYFEITQDKEIRTLVDLFKEMEHGLFLPHRPYEYNVYINFNNYQKGKFDVKLSKIDSKLVFFFKGNKYQNDTLAKKIIEILKIRRIW